MRLFLAIELPVEVRRHLREMQEILRPIVAGRWMKPEQLHLTLKFLGETPDGQLPGILRELEGVRIDEPIHLETAGVVCFPPAGRIRIVAAALEDAQGRCAELAGLVDRACHAAGFRLEGRKWAPHVTLARLKAAPASARQQILEARLPSRVGFEVDEISLMESRLDRQGASYVRVGRMEIRP